MNVCDMIAHHAITPEYVRKMRLENLWNHKRKSNGDVGDMETELEMEEEYAGEVEDDDVDKEEQEQAEEEEVGKEDEYQLVEPQHVILKTDTGMSSTCYSNCDMM